MSSAHPEDTDTSSEDTPAEPEATNPFDPRVLLDQMGGLSGLIYSAAPVVVLVPVNSRFGLVPAVGAALGVALLVLIWRVIRGESTQPAVSGFVGVGISALIAYLVGSAKGYFLFGIWVSLAWAVVFAASVLVRRPVVGYIWGWLGGHGRDWRTQPRAVRAFDIATRDLAEHSQSGGQFFGIHASNRGRIMIFAGGIPLLRDGKVVGAIGVSGGSGEQDHAVAEAGAAAF